MSPPGLNREPQTAACCRLRTLHRTNPVCLAWLVQIFEELRKVGKRHELSAGLLIGGKDVREEQARVNGA